MTSAATSAAWLLEVRRRIAIAEGIQTLRYLDTVGVPTIGIGFNLQRSDALDALRKVGCADPEAVVLGLAPLTLPQVYSLFDYSFQPILREATASVTHFERLSPARAFVVCDLVFNLGDAGWLAFGGTRQLLDAATVATDPELEHRLYGHAADHLTASAWFLQTGNRARRDVAMIRSSDWVDAQGDGSD